MREDRRRAPDGHTYTWDEFVEYFDSEAAWYWTRANPLASYGGGSLPDGIARDLVAAVCDILSSLPGQTASLVHINSSSRFEPKMFAKAQSAGVGGLHYRPDEKKRKDIKGIGSLPRAKACGNFKLAFFEAYPGVFEIVRGSNPQIVSKVNASAVLGTVPRHADRIRRRIAHPPFRCLAHNCLKMFSNWKTCMQHLESSGHLRDVLGVPAVAFKTAKVARSIPSHPMKSARLRCLVETQVLEVAAEDAEAGLDGSFTESSDSGEGEESDELDVQTAQVTATALTATCSCCAKGRVPFSPQSPFEVHKFMQLCKSFVRYEEADIALALCCWLSRRDWQASLQSINEAVKSYSQWTGLCRRAIGGKHATQGGVCVRQKQGRHGAHATLQKAFFTPHPDLFDPSGLSEQQISIRVIRA